MLNPSKKPNIKKLFFMAAIFAVFFFCISISKSTILSYISKGNYPQLFDPAQKTFSPFESRAVLAATDSVKVMNFNLKTVFKNDVILSGANLDAGSGSLTARQLIATNLSVPNVVYTLSAGTGIGVVGGQTPVISNTGVLSFQGQRGVISLNAGDGITIDGTTISNTRTISLAAGDGISINGNQVTNLDKGSSQNIFKTIAVHGQTGITATLNSDTLTLVEGTGIILNTDPVTKKVTITSQTVNPASSTGWERTGTNVHLVTTTDNVGIGTSIPIAKVDVAGSINITSGSAFRVNGDSVLNFTTLGTGVVVSSLTQVGTLTALNVNGDFVLGQNLNTGAINTSDWDISTTGVLTGISGVTTDGGYIQTGSSVNAFTGNVGIGSAAPGTKLDVNGDLRVASGSDFYVNTVGLNDNASTSSGASLIGLNDDIMTYISANTNLQSAIKQLDTAIGNVTPGANIWTNGGTYLYPTSGEVLGNSTTAGSNKLAGIYLADSAPLYFGTDNDINFSFDNTTAVLNVTQGNADVNFDANSLFIDGSANNVGIGTNTPVQALEVNGRIKATGFYLQNASSSIVDNNSSQIVYSVGTSGTARNAFDFISGAHSYTTGTGNLMNIGSTMSFNPTSGTAVFNGVNLAPTINQTGGANGITRGLYINPTITAAADWRSLEVARGNALFGTISGNLGIGTTNPTERLYVNGNQYTSGTGTFGSFLSATAGIFSDSLIVGPTTSDIDFRTSGTIQLGKASDSFITISPNALNQWHANPNSVMIDTGASVKIGDPQEFGNKTYLEVNDNFGSDSYIAMNIRAGNIYLGDYEDAISSMLTIDLDNQQFSFANGNVGIGTTRAEEILDVRGGIRLGANSNANNVLNTTSGSTPTGILYWGDREVCDNTGNCAGATGAYIALQSSTPGNQQTGNLNISGRALFGGNVGIGSTAPANFKLEVNGNIGPSVNSSGAGVGFNLGSSSFKFDTVYASQGTINTSDERLKTNITALNYGLNEIMQLNAVSFNWASNPSGGTKLGLIAQQVQGVIPEVVRVGDDAQHTLGIYYSDLIPVTIKAIQEQQGTINMSLATQSDLQQKYASLAASMQHASTEPSTTESTDLAILLSDLSTRTDSNTTKLATIENTVNELNAKVASLSGVLGTSTSEAVLASASAILDGPTATVSALTVNNTAVISRLSVLDSFTQGMLTMNGVDTVEGVLGSSINTIVGPLRFQADALNIVEFEHGQIVMDQKGTLKLLQGDLEIQKGKIIGNDQIRGKATLKSGETSVRIDKTWDTKPTSVVFTPSYETKFWYEDVSETGFTIKVDTAPSSDQTIDWVALW